jgi:hypothetical protein
MQFGKYERNSIHLFHSNGEEGYVSSHLNSSRSVGVEQA